MTNLNAANDENFAIMIFYGIHFILGIRIAATVVPFHHGVMICKHISGLLYGDFASHLQIPLTKGA